MDNNNMNNKNMNYNNMNYNNIDYNNMNYNTADYNNLNYNQPPQHSESAGCGIASMVLGILALCLSCLYYISIPCAIIGVILGAVGIKRHAGRGMAIAGLICSIVSLVPAIIIISAGASVMSSLSFL